MNPDGTSVVTPVQRTSMTLQLQQPSSNSFSAPAAPEVHQNVHRQSCVLVISVDLIKATVNAIWDSLKIYWISKVGFHTERTRVDDVSVKTSMVKTNDGTVI